MSEQNPARILLVDDDVQARESMERILDLSGYLVVSASDGQAALDRLRQSGEQPFDLVLTDVRMPRLGGMEFLRAVKMLGEEVPVVLMTAFGK